jgi:chaperonin GroEL (HSP60 family)
MDDAKKNVVQKRLSQKMAEEMISALRSASSSDFDVFKSEMESLESIKGMRADFLTQLEDKQVALTKQKMISTGSKAAIKFNLETRRRLEREIAEIESSVSELDKEFLPAVEANIKDISEKISLTLMSAIVEGKKPYQIRFNEIC